MQISETVAALREALAGSAQPVFVPTMGNLHAGHLALVTAARQAAASAQRPVVASIFVNPLQFGAGEDFGRYPRTFAQDRARLETIGCDILFAPQTEEIYPEPQNYQVLPPLADQLCGAFRPGHFAGVCTVVLKLFNMVQPHCAVLGKKDYQQLFLLRSMVRQFNLPIDLLGIETYRAEDGLALSSRNGYLSTAERNEAPRLNAVLQNVIEQIAVGETNIEMLEQVAEHQLAGHGWRVDYISIRSQHTLLRPLPGDRDWVVLGAAHLGQTRLIDNLEVRAPQF